MLSKSLSELFSRDIPKIKTEIEAYTSEEAIWKKVDGINNSAGNLCLHLSGNLQHFFGAVLGGTDYKRDREFEFTGKVTRKELLVDLDAALKSVIDTLDEMPDYELKNEFPVIIMDKTFTIEAFFLHLYAHLSYHLGQINYHRRILDK